MGLLEQLEALTKNAAQPAAAAPAPPTPVAEAPPAPAPAPVSLPPVSAPLATQPQARVPAPRSSYHHNVEVTSLGDDTISTGEFVSYKGRKDVIDRVSILNARNVYFARVHYVEGDGGGFLICNSQFDKQGNVEIVTQMAPCCGRLEPPKKRFVALVAQYQTDPKGQVYPQMFAMPDMNPFTLKVWRFGEGIFDQLRTLDKQYPIDAHDLMVNCSDDQYQRLTITPCPESLVLHEVMKPYAPGIVAWVNSMTPKLEKMVGTRMGPKDWAEVLARYGGHGMGAPPAFGAASPMDVPTQGINELLQSIGASGLPKQ